MSTNSRDSFFTIIDAWQGPKYTFADRMLNPLNSKPTNDPTLKQFVGYGRQIIWVYLTIL